MEWTSLDDLESWIGQITRGGRFRGPEFLRPFHFSILASHMHRVGRCFTVPPALQDYATRMHLWQSVGLAAPTAVRERDPEGRFHPLAPIRSEKMAEDIAVEIREVFRSAGTADEATLNAIFIALSEIFSNCFFHAETAGDLCGLACAQTWPRGRLAQVVVTDVGIGIRNSLGSNPAYRERLRTQNAAELATEFRVTGKPAPARHSGYGLTVARQLMEKHGGSFVLLSGNEALTVTEHTASARELRTPWAGTIVVLEWRTDRPLDVGAVYRAWPKDHGDEGYELF